MVLRSPHAHARIVAIDAAAARALPGVLLVLTGADVMAEGLQPIPHIPAGQSPPDIRLDNLDGTAAHDRAADRPGGRTVRYVGEAVAFVVAETLALAKDAAEAIAGRLRGAAADRRHRRRCAGRQSGARPRAGFAEAAHVVRLETDIQRVTGVPMEPRAALGALRSGDGRYTVHAGGGAIVRPKKEIAIILGIAPEKVRVIAQDVGGNFGTRNFFYPEFALVAWASKKIGRPVKWTCERQEAFASDYAGRDFRIESELALDGRRQFRRPARHQHQQSRRLHRVLRAADQGHAADDQPLPTCRRLARARGVLSNTPSTRALPQRRPARDHVRDRAADRLGRARARLRPRRAAPAQSDPRDAAYATPSASPTTAATIAARLSILKLADWHGYEARRAGRGRAACGAASASPATSNSRAARRTSAPR